MSCKIIVSHRHRQGLCNESTKTLSTPTTSKVRKDEWKRYHLNWASGLVWNEWLPSRTFYLFVRLSNTLVGSSDPQITLPDLIHQSVTNTPLKIQVKLNPRLVIQHAKTISEDEAELPRHVNCISTWPEHLSLLLGHWYEIMALYYVKSILTEISASRQDRRVLQKSKIIRIEFLSKWGMLQTSRYV